MNGMGAEQDKIKLDSFLVPDETQRRQLEPSLRSWRRIRPVFQPAPIGIVAQSCVNSDEAAISPAA